MIYLFIIYPSIHHYIFIYWCVCLLFIYLFDHHLLSILMDPVILFILFMHFDGSCDSIH